MWYAALVFGALFSDCGASTIPTISRYELEIWIHRTAKYESDYRDHVMGDRGKSRGRYQIQRRPWDRYRPSPTWSWEVAAHDPVRSRVVARNILKACIHRCVRSGQIVNFTNARYWYRHGGY